MTLLHSLPILFGMIGLLYGGYVGLLSGFGFGSAWWIWPCACFLLFSFLWYRSKKRQGFLKKDLPDWLKVVLMTTAVLFLSLFLLMEFLIVKDSSGVKMEEEPEFLIVLGAKIRDTEPSLILKERLDAAVSFYREHQDVILVVCGGKGSDEAYAEADVMAYYLMNNGIPSGKIRKEADSVNTYENLENAKKLLYTTDAPVLLVTSDFHVFRSVQMARKLGYTSVGGMAAPSFKPLRLHYMVKECLSVAKSFLMGQL